MIKANLFHPNCFLIQFEKNRIKKQKKQEFINNPGAEQQWSVVKFNLESNSKLY